MNRPVGVRHRRRSSRRPAPGCPPRRTPPPTSALDSGSSGARIRSATSSTVTCTPNRENACAISAPIAPPPITISEPGSVREPHGVAVGPVRRVREPVDRRRRRVGAGVEHDAPAPRRTSSPSTSTVRGAGQPRRAADERRRRRPRAGRRRPGRPSRWWPRRGSARAPATSRASTVLVAGEVRDPPALGEHVGGADHHLARDAPVVGALAARPAGGRPRPPRGRPSPAGWPPTPRPGRARRRRRPPAGSRVMEASLPSPEPLAPRLLAWLTARTTTTTTPATPTILDLGERRAAAPRRGRWSRSSTPASCSATASGRGCGSAAGTRRSSSTHLDRLYEGAAGDPDGRRPHPRASSPPRSTTRCAPTT